MATINNPDDQEQNQKPGAPLAVSGTGGASASGGQGVGVGGAAPQSPVAQNQAPQANTGYTDVGTYLDANKAGSDQLGSMVSSNLTDQFNTTKSGIQSSAQNVQDQASKGYTPENSQLIQQAASNPVETAANPDNAAAVQAQLNDRYTGPADWADFGTQRGNVNTAMQTGDLVNTPGGLNVLAQQVEGKTGGNQSQGINQLDTLLLGGSPSAMTSVKAASDPFKTLNDYINQQNTAVKASIGSAQSAADTARNNATSALLGPSGATTQLNANLDSEVAAARQAAQAQNDQIKAALGTENPTPEQLATLGVSPEQWSALQAQLNLAQNAQNVSSNQGQFNALTGTVDITLPDFLAQQSPETALTRQNVANSGEYARAKALQTLVGDQNFTTDLTDPTQAGTAPKSLSKFDYENALGTTSNVANESRAAAQAYVDALQSGADEEHAQLAAQEKLRAMNQAAAATTMIGLPTAALSAAGVGGDVGRAADKFTQAIGNPVRKLETAAGIGAANGATGAGGTATSLAGQAATNMVGLGIPQAVNTITNMFCFHPDTLVEMADGTLLPICRIDVGDETRGGTVLATKKAVGTDFYWYRGVLVTGKHAVKEYGKWIRVENSALAYKQPNFIEVVHNLVTTKHRIYVHGLEFADEHETDQYESLNLDESLAKLNEPIR